MKKTLIISNLKDCFKLKLSFNDLALIENEFKKHELSEIIKNGGFKVLSNELSENYLLQKDVYLDFIFKGCNTSKEGFTKFFFVFDYDSLPI